MRRLILMFAAGLLAGGTVLTSGIVSASTTVARHITCTPAGSYYFSVTSSGISYYLGTRNKATSGSAAILRPSQNATTLWTLKACPKGDLLENRGLALTSRSSSSGANVTLAPPGNGGTGFASQQWFITCSTTGCSQWDFNDVKTVLWLQIRSSGPVLGQTVTTGNTPTDWTHS